MNKELVEFQLHETSAHMDLMSQNSFGLGASHSFKVGDAWTSGALGGTWPTGPGKGPSGWCSEAFF